MKFCLKLSACAFAKSLKWIFDIYSKTNDLYLSANVFQDPIFNR